MLQSRWVELILLFGLVPVMLIMWLSRASHLMMPVLVIAGVGSLLMLLLDKRFKRFRLWHTRNFVAHLKHLLILFVPIAVFTTLAVYYLAPDILFTLPNDAFGLWVTTLMIYPIISVIPQELIFRTFFFHRYKQILPSKLARLGISTASFTSVHLLYGNWIAVVLSFVGGALFGYRYIKTRSTLVVAIEHCLWGSFLFTVGIGIYLLKTNPT